MTSEKYTRRFPRRRFSKPVGMIHGGTYEIVDGVEIGEGGILFQTAKEIQPGQLLCLNFFVPSRGFISVRGEILYRKKNDEQVRHFGIKFLELDFKCKRMIRDYIALKSADEALGGTQFSF